MYLSVTITYPDESSAKSITQILLEKRIVACANLYPVESVYWWKGEIEHAKEWKAEYKTRSDLFTDIEREVRKHHPYENPCIIAHSIENGAREYLEWIKESTK